MGIEFGKKEKGDTSVRNTYELLVHLTTSSVLEPRQIIGEAVDDYNKNYGGDSFADVKQVRKL